MKKIYYLILFIFSIIFNRVLVLAIASLDSADTKLEMAGDKEKTRVMKNVMGSYSMVADSQGHLIREVHAIQTALNIPLSDVRPCCKDDGMCWIDLDKEVLPDHLQKILGLHPTVDGPNCFNASLYFHQVLPYIESVSQVGIESILNSPLCEDVTERERSPGDIGHVFDQNGEEHHTFVYISQELLFQKLGRYVDSKYEFTGHGNIKEFQKTPSRYNIKYYQCTDFAGFVQSLPEDLKKKYESHIGGILKALNHSKNKDRIKLRESHLDRADPCNPDPTLEILGYDPAEVAKERLSLEDDPCLSERGELGKLFDDIEEALIAAEITKEAEYPAEEMKLIKSISALRLATSHVRDRELDRDLEELSEDERHEYLSGKYKERMEHLEIRRENLNKENMFASLAPDDIAACPSRRIPAAPTATSALPLSAPPLPPPGSSDIRRKVEEYRKMLNPPLPKGRGFPY